MKRLLIFTSIFTLLLSTLIFAEKKQWRQPKLKEDKSVQEAFREFRATRSEINKERKNKFKDEKKSRRYNKKQEKKMRRAKASKSQIDRLDPRKSEINDLMDIKHENVLLGGNENETGKNREKK